MKLKGEMNGTNIQRVGVDKGHDVAWMNMVMHLQVDAMSPVVVFVRRWRKLITMLCKLLSIGSVVKWFQLLPLI